MIFPLQLWWLFGVVVLFLVLLALLELHRSNYRREHEVMVDSDAFAQAVAENGFSEREATVLEKLVRGSKFENKDSILNSSTLYEEAVSDYYDYRNVNSVSNETLEIIAALRERLNYTARNPLATICSSRQFNVGDRMDLFLDGSAKMKHSEILRRSERDMIVSYDGSLGAGENFVGRKIRIRWTRPEDAVYSALVEVLSARHGVMVLSHVTEFEKKQLRRWVREIVNFPVEATLADGSTCQGLLYDLSAGGILLGLPVECIPDQHIRIKFELPSFGVEDVEIQILRCLGQKNADHPELYSQTASFSGAFGWTQERVLQYIFELHKGKNGSKKA